jgi:potassium/chloride transporter 4/5/6
MSESTKKYGTLLGVFTPSILTILGAIMFLRFGWVLGNTGLWGCLAIVILANSITLITSLSVSSLATSQRVGVGGAYFLISRALGKEMGGAIGLPLYLSQSISLTLYCYALAESINFMLPEGQELSPVVMQILAAALIIGVTFSALKATDLVLKSQLFIFGLVGFSIISLGLGVDWNTPNTIVEMNFSSDEDLDFFGVFAVFFPAVTGILTGLSLSGDLKDPEKSLPQGTLFAVLVGFVIYLFIPIGLSHYADPEALRNNPLVWMDAAKWSWLIFPGLISAILSSAVGSILAAPRTLQAMSDDGILPSQLGVLEDGEPKFAMYLSSGVALLAVLLGDLNTVATVVTLFFLTTYGMINIVSALESWVGNPSFRPKMKTHWLLSLVAAFGCFGVMILIEPVASLVAIVIEIGIYYVLARKSMESTWGDMRAGIMMAISRRALLAHRNLEEHPRNWRPHILVFCREIKQSIPMVQLADDLSQGRGIVTVAHLKTGNIEEYNQIDEDIEKLNFELTRNGLEAFCEVNVVPDLSSGILTIAQANGIAGMHSNTLILGWPSANDFPPEAIQMMKGLDRLGKSLLLVRLQRIPTSKQRSIDIWWSGTQNNGDLMLLISHMLSQSGNWRRSTINIKIATENPSEITSKQKQIEKLIEQSRIPALVFVVHKAPGIPLNTLIRKHSATSDLVLFGLGLPGTESATEFGTRYSTLIEGLDNVILVRNSSPFRGFLLDTERVTSGSLINETIPLKESLVEEPPSNDNSDEEKVVASEVLEKKNSQENKDIF